jgi:hypothetical protein
VVVALQSLPGSLVSLKSLIRPTASAAERVLPVRADLAGLLPLGGFRRGTVAEISHGGLLYAALVDAMAEGAWAAIVGAPLLGVAAAADHGIAMERLAIVDTPPLDQAAAVLAALVDAIDVVVVGSIELRASDARRLSARLRERNGVLISMGTWPEAAELKLDVTEATWVGIERGHGHLQGWDLEVRVTGRGAAARGRSGKVSLAAPTFQEAFVSICTPTVSPALMEEPFRLERVS